MTKYPIGGRMLIPTTLSDGIDYSADVEIVGRNHDNLADGSGKAPITFLCKDLPGFKHKMYDNSSNSNPNGWSGSDMRQFTNGELYESLPENLKKIIKLVIKQSDGGESGKVLVDTEDLCWIPSCEEVGISISNSNNYVSGQGEHYSEIFGSGTSTSAKNSRLKYPPNSGTPERWWLRSSSYGDYIMFFRIQNSGGYQSDGIWTSHYVVFGFCI